MIPRSSLRAILELALKELRVLRRDRQALLLLFLMPAAFILLLSLALRDVFEEKTGGVLAVTLRDHDAARPARRVRERLEAQNAFRIVPEETASRPGEEGRGEARAIITVPEGFSEDFERFLASRGRESFDEGRIRLAVDPVLDAAFRNLLEAGIVAAVQGAMLDELGWRFDPRGGKQGEGAEAGPGSPKERGGGIGTFLEPTTSFSGRAAVPTPLQQTVPAWSLFAMFFIAVPLAGSSIRERADGTLERLLTYPIPRSAIVAGKLLPYLLVSVLQFAAMLAMGLLVGPLLGVPGLELGAHPFHLVPVTLAAALAATGFGVLVAALSRTAEQAGALGATTVIVLAVAGGVMVPTFVMPAFMRKLALLSPLHWGLEAYFDVLLRNAPLLDIAPKLLALGGFAGIAFAVAAWRLKAH